MVARPLSPNVFEVTTFGTLHDMPCDHVINWFYPGDVAGNESAICQKLAQLDVQYWNTTFGPLLPPYYTLTASRALYLGDTTVTPVTQTSAISGTGTPPYGVVHDCVTIRHTSSVRGRGMDGRTNLPGPSIADLASDNRSLIANAVGAYNDAWARYINGMHNAVVGSSGVPFLVILTRKTGLWHTPQNSQVDVQVNTHRRWKKTLSRHR